MDSTIIIKRTMNKLKRTKLYVTESVAALKEYVSVKDKNILKNRFANLLAFGPDHGIDLSSPSVNRLEGEFSKILTYKKKMAKMPLALFDRLKEFNLVESDSTNSNPIATLRVTITDYNNSKEKQIKLINKTLFYQDKPKIELPSITNKSLNRELKRLNDMIADQVYSSLRTSSTDMNLFEFFSAPYDIRNKFIKAVESNEVIEEEISFDDFEKLIKQKRVITTDNSPSNRTAIELKNSEISISKPKLYFDYVENKFIFEIGIMKMKLDDSKLYKVRTVQVTIPDNIRNIRPAKPIPLAETDLSKPVEPTFNWVKKHELLNVADAPYCKRIDSLTEELSQDDPCNPRRIQHKKLSNKEIKKELDAVIESTNELSERFRKIMDGFV